MAKTCRGCSGLARRWRERKAKKMAKRYHASICEDGSCTDIGEFRDQAKAEARVAKEAKKRWKRHSKEKIPKGHIHGEVRGVEGGVYDSKPVYETEMNAGEPAPKVKRRRSTPSSEAAPSE